MSSFGAWITEAMLVQAIDQYLRCSSGGACRRINSHAGPLESRRRAAKRRMTGLMPTSQPFPTLWQYDVGPRTPKWEAPTSPERRRQKRELSRPGFVNKIVGWLDSSGPARESTIEPLALPLQSDSTQTKAPAWDSTLGSVTLQQPTVQKVAASPDFPEEILSLRTGILNLELADYDDLFTLGKNCMASLRKSIVLGALSVEGLKIALDPLDEPSKDRFPNVDVANKMCAMIRRGILHAMSDAWRNDPAAVPGTLWLAFTESILSDKSHWQDAQLFWRLMDVLPAALKDAVSFQHVQKISCAFVFAQANRHNVFAHWGARAARFSQALQNLDQEMRNELDGRMEKFVEKQSRPSKIADRVRFSWLTVKAYGSADLTTRDFVATYYRCTGPEYRLGSMQRWQVLVARLAAIGALDPKICEGLLSRDCTSVRERWSQLLETIMQSDARDAGFRELCAFLTGIGEFAASVRPLTFPPAASDALAAVVSALDDHKQALELFYWADRKPRRNPWMPVLPWSVWPKHVEKIIKDPALDPAIIWQVLKLTYVRPGLKDDEEAFEEETRAKSRLLDQMGLWFVEADHLSDRQVLRSIQRCINQQRALTKAVSPKSLAHVLQVLCRDLEKGQHGRPARVMWLLGMVAQNQGQQQAEQTALAIEGWQDAMDKSCLRTH